MQSVIDCMVELNPHQIKHIQKTQPDFRCVFNCWNSLRVIIVLAIDTLLSVSLNTHTETLSRQYFTIAQHTFFRFKPRNIVLSKEPSAEEKHAAAVAKAARRAEIMKENDEKLALESAVATAVGSGNNSKGGSGANSGGGSGVASGTGSAKHNKPPAKESAAVDVALDTVESTDSVDEAEKRDTFAENSPSPSPAPSAPQSPLRDGTERSQLLDDEGNVIPMLKEIGPGLSTIVESNDNDSGTSTPTSQRSFVRESTTPSLFMQAQRNLSKSSGVNILNLESPSNTNNPSKPGFNDSGSDLGIDAEPMEINTDLAQGAEDNNLADVSDTQSPTNSNHLTRSNTAESKEGYNLSGANSGSNLENLTNLTSAARLTSGVAASAAAGAGAGTGAGMKPPGTPYTETGTEPDRHYMSGRSPFFYFLVI